MKYSEAALNKLSDADLLALDAGNYEGISDAGLQALDADKPLTTAEKVIGLVGQAGQGAGFNLVDEVAAGVATPPVAAMQGRSDFGNIYSENLKIGRDLLGRTRAEMPGSAIVANVAGGLRTAGGYLANSRNAGQLMVRSGNVGAAYGAGGGEGMMNRATQAGIGWGIGAPFGALGKAYDTIFPQKRATVQELKDGYRTAKNSLKNIEFDRKNLQGLADEVNREIAPNVFGITKASAPTIPAAIDDVNGFVASRPNAYQLDEWRSQLGTDPLSNRMRGIVDDFTEGNAIPTQFRDQYRRAKLAETMGAALDKGGDSVTQMRTRIRTATTKAKGLTDAERAALKRAGSIGVGEGLLRVGKLPAAILSGATTFGGSFNPAGGAGVMLGGKLLDSAADGIAKRRAQDALDVILNGGERGLTYKQRFGALMK